MVDDVPTALAGETDDKGFERVASSPGSETGSVVSGLGQQRERAGLERRDADAVGVGNGKRRCELKKARQWEHQTVADQGDRRERGGGI